MLKTSTTGFCKNESCPTSHELLAFQNGDSSRAARTAISQHLIACEFCEAEVLFYSRFPQEAIEESNVETTKIPAPLFELAEALLKKHHTTAKSLNALLKDKNGLGCR